MIRKIIKIDEEKCSGYGLCAEACHEGAIGIVDGKAKLLREDYCDGLVIACPLVPRTRFLSRNGKLPPMTRLPYLKQRLKNPREFCPAAARERRQGS